MFTVYSDRLEIVSHGAMAPKQTVEGFFKGVSVPVNQKLSDMFLQLHISERSGRGVPKIVEAFGRESYEFRDGSIALTIPFNRIDAIESENPNPVAKIPTNLNRTQQRVLEEIRSDPNVTYDQIAAAIGKGKSTVNNAVRFLREHGFIERVGSDKTGWWRVL